MANRGWLLPGWSPTSNGSSSSTSSALDSLGHVASISLTLTSLLGAKNLPSIPPPTPSPASPAQNTPMKLVWFLQHAQDKLGMPNVLECEGQLSYCRYGPKIIPYVSNASITKCSFAEGDVIHLKRGAKTWWASPEPNVSRHGWLRPHVISHMLFISRSGLLKEGQHHSLVQGWKWVTMAVVMSMIGGTTVTRWRSLSRSF